MPVIEAGIVMNEDKSLSFGNHLVKEKVKVKDFDADGLLYSVKTHNEVTRLEQNGKLLIECVPGASFYNFTVSEDETAFAAYGSGVTNFTLELAPDTEYRFFVGHTKIGEMKSNMYGKIAFSAELTETESKVRIKRV